MDKRNYFNRPPGKCDREHDIEDIKRELELIREDMHEVRKDIKSLLQFKWKAIGSSLAILSMLTIGINLYTQIKH